MINEVEIMSRVHRLSHPISAGLTAVSEIEENGSEFIVISVTK